MAKVIDVKNDYVFIQNKDEYLQLRTYLCDFYPTIGDEVIILKDEKGNITKVVLPITLKGLDENQEVKEEVKVEVKKEEKKKQVVFCKGRKLLIFTSILAILIGGGFIGYLLFNQFALTGVIYEISVLAGYGLIILLAVLSLFIKKRGKQLLLGVILFLLYLGAIVNGYWMLAINNLWGILTFALWGIPALLSIVYFVKAKPNKQQTKVK